MPAFYGLRNKMNRACASARVGQRLDYRKPVFWIHQKHDEFSSTSSGHLCTPGASLPPGLNKLLYQFIRYRRRGLLLG